MQSVIHNFAAQFVSFPYKTLHQMKTSFAFVNDAFIPHENAGLSIGDLGIQRGYGIFDFLRIDGTKPLFLEDHLDRFFNSAAFMRLKINHSREEIKAIVYTLIERNNLHHSGLKLLLTGGDSEDGYTVSKPRFSIIQQSLTPPPADLPEKGIRIVTRDYQRQLPEVKTTEYLMAIWLQDWMREMGGEEILYHHNGNIRECPRSNFFVIKEDDTLVTPASEMLKGITRKNIIHLASELGMKIEIRNISLHELKDAKAAFICSSTKRIMPVNTIDRITYNLPDSLSVMQALWQGLLSMERASFSDQ